MFYNFVALFFIYLVFFLTVYGYGKIAEKLFLKNLDLSHGEYGIFGFVLIYLVVTFIHFFSPINNFISVVFFALGIVSFFLLFNIKNKKIKKENLNYIFIFLLFILISTTNNHHDDLYIFVLPIINYMQDFKVVFGLINLNDYVGQGHSLYEIMSIFKIPYLNNRAYFLIPILFLHFFIILLFDTYKKNKSFFVKNFIFFLIIVLSLRFNRSKEFGTDLSVLCLLFYIQLNIIKFIFENNLKLLLKSCLAFVFALVLKIYSFVSFFYLLIFILLAKKNLFDIASKNKKIVFFISTILILTVVKNIIVSGCIVYPIKTTCFDKNVFKWSITKEIAGDRKEFYSAQVMGWKSYTKNINKKKFISSKDYLSLGKVTHFKALAKDGDFEKILSGIFIVIFFILIIFFAKGNFEKLKIKVFEKTIIVFISLLPFLIWLMMFPQSRYGYYAYLSFFIIMFFYQFKGSKKINSNFVKFIIFSLLVFVSLKNFKRIYYEVLSSDNESYPIKQFRITKTETFFINNIELRVPIKSRLECGNTRMFCASYAESISQILLLNNYYFLINRVSGLKKHLEKSANHDMIEMNN